MGVHFIPSNPFPRLVVKAVLGSDGGGGGGGGSGYEIVKSLGVSFDLSPRQKAVVECLRAPRAQNFLTVIPIEGLGPTYVAGISSRKEAPVNFLTDPLEGRSTLRLTDILVFGWVGKHACVDLTGVSPLVGLRDNGFVAGQAALKAESSKVAKHEKACLENQHVFIPFAFDTFGFLAPEAEEFLNRVDSRVFPIFVPLYTGGVLEKDPAPHLTARQEQAVQVLSSNKAPFRRYPECFLALVGLSPYYPFGENTYPAFERPDRTDMGLLDYIRTADPRKVQAVEVQKGEEQVTLLESIKHCVRICN
ncbi:hypothetical protein Tco_0784888 [Tanacetum coccineum]